MTLSFASIPALRSPYAPQRPYVSGTRKIRVLLVSHTCQSRTEGQPKAHALAALPDIDLHLLTPARWMHYGSWRNAEPPLDPAFGCSIESIRLGWAGPAQYFLHYYPALPRLLKTFKPDVIDLWEEPWGLVSAHACRLRNRLLPFTKIISETEQNIFKNLPFPFERFRSFTLKNADFVVGRNTESIEHLRRKGYRGEAEVVPNAVDTALFRPLDRSACRRKIAHEGRGEIPADAFLAGYAGRLVPEKGLMDLLDALPMCPAHVHVVFLGSGPLEPDLHRRVLELSLAQRVHFLPARPLEQLPEFMNALDVFILPSRTTTRWKEQFGRVIIEAQACGTPVIGTDSGAIADVIADAGLIAPEQSPEKLSQALTFLAQNPEVARQFRERGLHYAREYFTWQRVAERMACIYQRLTG